ncbi:MAG: sterol desaturase family protein [Microscillaceae bacterium]|jgi:sterol desaturase/sphingolipid hydroxylase (fatty acid hydroxylase superfamily)|nr:sterol desaturase family protein [Microscillaceae bacterium]
MTTWEVYTRVFSAIGLRYALTAGLAFVLFYVVFGRRWQWRKIQRKFPENQDYRREIFYSALSIAIFALVPIALVFNPAVRPYTRLVENANELSTGYFWLAFGLMFFLHDAYFYWTHRLMHHPLLYKYFHLVHHKSVNPSPWAAYSFHPLETIVEVGIYVVLIFTLPLHRWHIFFFFLFQIIYNVYGHLGYELYPRGFHKTWVGRWVNTSVSHNMHHRYFKGNYGLYTLIWDRLMGTLHSDYDKHFEQATQKPWTKPQEVAERV